MTAAVHRTLARTLTRSRLSVPCQLVVDGGEIIDTRCIVGSKQALTPVGAKTVLVTSVVLQVAIDDLPERPKAGHTVAAGKKRYRIDLEPSDNGAGMWELADLTYLGPATL